jgi:hypothetical protein
MNGSARHASSDARRRTRISDLSRRFGRAIDRYRWRFHVRTTFAWLMRTHPTVIFWTGEANLAAPVLAMCCYARNGTSRTGIRIALAGRSEALAPDIPRRGWQAPSGPCGLSGRYFQPAVRPACSIHFCNSGVCASSRLVTLMYRVRSVVPSGGGDSKSAPPRKRTFTETS